MQKINHSEKFFTKQNPTGITLNPTSLPNFIFWIELGAINQILGFPGDSMVKTAPANAGDTGLILGSGRSLEEEMAAYCSILAWRIIWTEEYGWLVHGVTDHPSN